MSRKDYIGIAPQDAFGTPATTLAYFPPVTSADIGPSQELMEIDETTGTRFPDGLEFGKQDVGGSIEGAARPSSFGLILASFFGAPTTTQPGGAGHDDVYQHAYDPVANEPVALTMTPVNADPTVAIVRELQDCIGDSLSISISPGDYLMYNASFLGTSSDITVEAPTSDLDDGRKWPFHKVTVEMVAAGATYAECAVGELDITYGNGLDGDNYKLGSRTRYDIDLGNASCEVSFLALDDEADHFAAALAEAPDDYKLRFTAEGEDIDVDGTYQYALVFEVPRLQYRTAPAAVSASATMKGIQVSMTAALDSATDKFVSIVLTNTEDGSDYRPASIS